jgi:hypothetical protein
MESGCTRLIDQVEYFATGKVADWQNGFITVYFETDGDKVRFYASPTIIVEGKCLFNSVIYNGNV